MKRKNIYKNIITWKIKYSCSDEDLSIILDYIKAYNPVLRYTYNRYVENPKIDTKELYELQKTINKSNLIKSHLMNCCIYDSKSLYGENGDKVIFGGRANFINRCQHKIDKETFQFNRLVPLYSVGESSKYGNRFFTIADKDTIMFKPLLVDEIKRIIEIFLDSVRNRLNDRNITLEITDKAKDYLANEGYDPIYGARPLKRFIQNTLENLLARKIIKGEIQYGSKVVADIVDEQLVLNV